MRSVNKIYLARIAGKEVTREAARRTAEVRKRALDRQLESGHYTTNDADRDRDRNLTFESAALNRGPSSNNYLKGAPARGGKRTAKAGKRKPEPLQSVLSPLFDATRGIPSPAATGTHARQNRTGMEVKNALEAQRAGRPTPAGGGPPVASGSATIPYGHPVGSQFSNSFTASAARKSVAFSPQMNRSPSKTRASKTSQIKKRAQFQAGTEEEPELTLQRDIPDRARNQSHTAHPNSRAPQHLNLGNDSHGGAYLHSSKISHGGRHQNDPEATTSIAGSGGDALARAGTAQEYLASPKSGKELTLYKLNKRLRNRQILRLTED